MMMRLACGLLLVALNGVVAAAWERIGAADDGMVVYADPATIQTVADVVKMQALLDYQTAEKDATGKPYLSVKLLHEYDCKGERARTRYFSFHSGQMGAGQLVYSEVRNDADWLAADRAIIGETLWKRACGKK
jgi:aminoglycoside phosphotransferase